MKWPPKNLKRTKGYSAHGVLTEGAQLKIGCGVVAGLCAGVKNWLVSSATLSFDTRELGCTLITKAIKRQRSINCLEQILTQLLLGVGIYTSGDSDRFISRESNTTGFLLGLADKGSGLRGSVSLKGNHWLQARPVYALLFVRAHRPGLPEPKR